MKKTLIRIVVIVAGIALSIWLIPLTLGTNILVPRPVTSGVVYTDYPAGDTYYAVNPGIVVVGKRLRVYDPARGTDTEFVYDVYPVVFNNDWTGHPVQISCPFGCSFTYAAQDKVVSDLWQRGFSTAMHVKLNGDGSVDAVTVRPPESN